MTVQFGIILVLAALCTLYLVKHLLPSFLGGKCGSCSSCSCPAKKLDPGQKQH